MLSFHKERDTVIEEGNIDGAVISSLSHPLSCFFSNANVATSLTIYSLTVCMRECKCLYTHWTHFLLPLISLAITYACQEATPKTAESRHKMPRGREKASHVDTLGDGCILTHTHSHTYLHFVQELCTLKLTHIHQVT